MLCRNGVFCLAQFVLVIIFFLASQFVSAQVVPAQNLQQPKQQKQQDTAKRRDKGFSPLPLYRQVGSECQKLLQGDKQWVALPRPVNRIWLNPAAKPCFSFNSRALPEQMAMQNGKKSEIARWSAEKDWGPFKLVQNGTCVGWDGDDLVLKDMSFLNENQWRRYTPPGGTFARSRTAYLAHAGPGSWWWAGNSELYRIENGTLRRISLDDWKDTPVQGVVSNRQGYAVAWSSPIKQENTDKNNRPIPVGYAKVGYAKVAYFDKHQWHTIELPCKGVWNFAHIQEDGKLLLAGRHHHIFVPRLTGTNLRQVEADLDPDDANRENNRQGKIRIGESWYTRTTFSHIPSHNRFAMTLDGELLYSAWRDDTEESAYGLIYINKDGETKWIDWPLNSTSQSRDFTVVQITAQSDNSFIILDRNRGLFRLAPGDLKATKLTEVNGSDELLGCDVDGRIYVRRGYAILFFLPSANPNSVSEAREELNLIASQSSEDTPLAAAIDSDGNLVAIDDNFQLRVLSRRGRKDVFDSVWVKSDDGRETYVFKRKFERQLVPEGYDQKILESYERSNANVKAPVSVWPGRNGWTLVLYRDQQAALVSPKKKKFILEQSLLQLAINAYETMLAAAPLETIGRKDSPWLALGQSIWISDSKGVYRLSKRSPDAPETPVSPEIQQSPARPRSNNRPANPNNPALNFADVCVQRVGSEPAKMLGPIASGELILSPSPIRKPPRTQNVSLKSCVVVTSPSENAGAVFVGSLGGANVENDRFRTIAGHRKGGAFLDSKKSLWLDLSSGPTFQVADAKKWLERKNIQSVGFEDSSGAVWGLQSAKNPNGYHRIIGDDEYSVRSTYLNHLSPIANHEGHVICHTPIGLAKLEIDPKFPQSARVIASTTVHWPGQKKYYLGITKGRIWFVVQRRNGNYQVVANILTSVSLEGWADTPATVPTKISENAE